MKTHLSLFTGSGIDSLIFKKWGYRTVAYVENNKHCQERIRKRIEDGHIDEAPIFGDIQIFAGFAVGIAKTVFGFLLPPMEAVYETVRYIIFGGKMK